MRKRRIALGVLLAVCWAMLDEGCIAAQDNTARMEQVVQSYVGNKQFMGSVLVVRDKTVVFNKGYGYANLEWEIPDTPTTKFQLGSITKQFTAASIFLLEERGKLKVDDTVKKYMTDAPAAWDKVTIYNLLTHTSGIPSFTVFRTTPRRGRLRQHRKSWCSGFATNRWISNPGKSGATAIQGMYCWDI